MSAMEFFSERKVTAKKEHTCEMCGRVINVGEKYWQEKGVFYGDFFHRNMHDHCRGMEHKYCCDVDSEFSWDSITDYIAEIECRDCEHSGLRDDEEGWTGCPYADLCTCPKLIEKYKSADRKEQQP
jgi:hypothetical protein